MTGGKTTRPTARQGSGGSSSTFANLYALPTPDADIERARRVVAANASDAPEAARLLAMLGLTPGAEEITMEREDSRFPARTGAKR